MACDIFSRCGTDFLKFLSSQVSFTYLVNFALEREREGERERETDRHRERQRLGLVGKRERQTDRQRETDRARERERDRQT